MKKRYKQAAYDEAIALRRRGFTYEEIAKIVQVSKSTVSNWLKGEKWSEKLAEDNKKRAAKENSKRISLLNKARTNQNKKLYKEAERSAEIEFKHYKHSPLFVAGLTLYIASGDIDADTPIRLTSTNPVEHHVFIQFLTEFCGAEKKQVKFWLLLHKNIKTKHIEKWWSKQVHISPSQFGKTQVLAVTSGSESRGSGNTIVYSAILKRRILSWINLLTKELK